MKTFLRKCLLLIAMLAPVCGLSAEEVTFTAGTDITTASPLTKNPITISWTGTSKSDPDFKASPYKIRQNNSVTFSHTGGGKITKIVFTADSANKGSFAGITVNTGTKSDDGLTWTGNAESVTVTAGSGKQLQISTIVVTYGTSGSTDPEKTATTVTFADGDKTFTQGDGDQTFSNIATVKDNEGNVIADATVTYNSSDENIAIVDNGEVVVSTDNIGTATITATYAGNDTYNGSSASYTITVKKAVITGADNYVKIDGTDDFTGKYVMVGHNESAKKYQILTAITSGNSFYSATDVTLNGNQINKIPDTANDHAVFTISNLEVEGDYKYALLNTTTGKYINIAGGGNNKVSEVSNSTANTTHASFTYNEGKTAFEINFNVNSNNLLRFNASASRFSSYGTSSSGMQPIQLFRHGYSRTVTNEWGTLCLPYGGTISGANLYTIEGKDAETATELYLTKVEKVEAGKPYIIKVTAEDKTFTVYYEGDINTTAANEGSLIGSYNGTNVAEGMYVINGNTVKKCGANSKIGTNRSYIDMSQVNVTTASANATILSFDDTATAIEGIQANADSKSAIYDLSGRRVKATKKGLYIVNGKKVIK